MTYSNNKNRYGDRIIVGKKNDKNQTGFNFKICLFHPACDDGIARPSGCLTMTNTSILVGQIVDEIYYHACTQTTIDTSVDLQFVNRNNVYYNIYR